MSNIKDVLKTVHDDGEKLLKTGEVAKILKIHPNTVRALVTRGELTPIRHNSNRGSHYRFYEQDVMRLLAIQNYERLTKLNQEVYAHTMTIINEAELINSDTDIRKFIRNHVFVKEERAILEVVINAMNPYVIFGSHMETANERMYSRMLQGNDEVWVTESLRSMLPKGMFTTKDGRIMIDMLELMIKVGFGYVNGYVKTYLIVHLKSSEKTFYFDGTMQQLFPLMKKGIVVFNAEQAEQVYQPQYEVSITDYVDIVLKNLSSQEKMEALFKLVGEEYVTEE